MKRTQVYDREAGQFIARQPVDCRELVASDSGRYSYDKPVEEPVEADADAVPEPHAAPAAERRKPGRPPKNRPIKADHVKE